MNSNPAFVALSDRRFVNMALVTNVKFYDRLGIADHAGFLSLCDKHDMPLTEEDAQIVGDWLARQELENEDNAHNMALINALFAAEELVDNASCTTKNSFVIPAEYVVKLERALINSR